MILAPMALALMCAEDWGALVERVELGRRLLSLSLNGVLAELGILAFAIWRRLPGRPPVAPTEGESP
jgi:hypothetical protein